MDHYGLDIHKKYTVYTRMNEQGWILDEGRIENTERVWRRCWRLPAAGRGSGRITRSLYRGWILTEAAHRAVRTSPYFRELFLKKRAQRGLQRAMITVTRQLLSFAYGMLKHGREYEERKQTSTSSMISLAQPVQPRRKRIGRVLGLSKGASASRAARPLGLTNRRMTVH